MEDEVLRATGGTWTGPGTITKAIFWQRCNTAGEGCATVVGATGPTYRLTAADVGTRLRVIETASNEGGTAQSPSAPTAVVDELTPTASRPTIAASKVNLPHRLLVDQLVAKQSGDKVTIRRFASPTPAASASTGVLVRATPTGLLAGSSAARATDSKGWATLRLLGDRNGHRPTSTSRQPRRARRPRAGVSSANLFRVRVS